MTGSNVCLIAAPSSISRLWSSVLFLPPRCSVSYLYSLIPPTPPLCPALRPRHIPNLNNNTCAVMRRARPLPRLARAKHARLDAREPLCHRRAAVGTRVRRKR
jgi:hypothetical protein